MLPWQQNLVLNANSSLDPGYPSAVLDFEWYCQYTTVNNNNISVITGCFGEHGNATDVKHYGALWVIPARTLLEGVNYLFTLKVMNRHHNSDTGDGGETRESTTQQNILLVDREIPILNLE